MEDVDNTNGNTLPNKVKVNLNMFGVLVLNLVGQHVDDADVVAIGQGSLAGWGVELT
jgi:hypothetical protein